MAHLLLGLFVRSNLVSCPFSRNVGFRTRILASQMNRIENIHLFGLLAAIKSSYSLVALHLLYAISDPGITT